MRNLDWLYQTNGMFRETVNQGAAQWMGGDSPAFAGEWLLKEHEPEPSDYEDLRGQHLDGPCVVPDRFCSDAAKLRISQFVAQETGQTVESDAAKSEIRDFADNREELVDRITDMVNAKWDELHGDSREKIEADVRDWADFFNSLNGDDRCEEAINAGHVAMILRWLDRQAAITERELCAGCDWPSIAATPDLGQEARIAEQDRRIVELSEELAKRDKGIERLKRRRGELMGQLRRLTAENVELAARVGELEAARSGLRENLAASASARDAALAGLAAERDRYRAALGRVLDHVDGALREGLSATSGAD